MRSRYEELRAQVLGQGDGRDALGLVVLLRQGVAAWIELCAERPPPAPRSGTSAEEAMPAEDAEHAELIRIVASTVLHHYHEELT